MGTLDGKVALVTGAASGIGRATAHRFVEEGAQVCLVDISESGRDVAEELGGIFIRADVGEPADNARMVETCLERLGRLDIAHLNAGVTCPESDIASLSDEAYRRIMRVNVDGVVFGIREVARAMERGGGGAIVVTASLAGLIGFAVDPVYTLTKHAVVGLVRSLPEHLGPRGIMVNCVNPGITATGLLGDDIVAEFAASGFPLLDAADVADAVMKVLAAGTSGECWPVQPGREPEPYRFGQVPGPRTPGAEGMAPPSLGG